MAVAGSWAGFSFSCSTSLVLTAAATAGRRSFCWGPARCVGARRPLLLCVGARRSSCRGPALYVGPGGLCVGASRHSLYRGPAPGALCVGAGGAGALCRGPALLASAQHCRGSASGLGAPLSRISLSGPGSLRVGYPAPCHIRARKPRAPACHPAPPAPIPVAPDPAPIRVPPIQPGAFPFSRRTPNLTVWGNTHIILPRSHTYLNSPKHGINLAHTGGCHNFGPLLGP